MEMSPFEPYPTVSLVGDATPAGWNLPSSVSMEKLMNILINGLEI